MVSGRVSGLGLCEDGEGTWGGGVQKEGLRTQQARMGLRRSWEWNASEVFGAGGRRTP